MTAFLILVFSRAIFLHCYITYFMAHSFYAYLAPPIVEGALLTCQNLDPEYKTTAFFHREKTLSYIRVNAVVLMLMVSQHHFLFCVA